MSRKGNAAKGGRGELEREEGTTGNSVTPARSGGGGEIEEREVLDLSMSSDDEVEVVSAILGSSSTLSSFAVPHSGSLPVDLTEDEELEKEPTVNIKAKNDRRKHIETFILPYVEKRLLKQDENTMVCP